MEGSEGRIRGEGEGVEGGGEEGLRVGGFGDWVIGVCLLGVI